MVKWINKLRLLSAAMASIVLSISPSHSIDIVITGPETTTNGGATIDGNDTLTIEQGGSITGIGLSATEATGDFYSLTNNGIIDTGTTGEGLSGLTDGFDNGNIVTFLNGTTGVITTDIALNLAGGFAGGNSITTLENRGIILANLGMTHAGFAKTMQMLNSGTITIRDTASGSAMTMAGGPVLRVPLSESLADGLVLMHNSGTINQLGTGDGMNLFSFGATNRLVNTGSISTTSGTAMWGTLRPADEAGVISELVASNSGTIATLGGVGMDVRFNEFGSYSGTSWTGRVTNSGSIMSQTGIAVLLREQEAGGIPVFGALEFVNTGSISSGGDDVVQVDQGGYSFINSGRIFAGAAASDAISVAGVPISITLLDGSELFGLVNLAAPASASLALGDGLDAAVTFSGGTPATITSANGHVVIGNTVYTSDTRDMTALDSTYAQISSDIASSIPGQPASGESSFAMAKSSRLAGSDPNAASPGKSVWARLLGGFSLDINDDTSGYDGYYGGAIVGRDIDATFGVFAGATAAATRGSDATPTDTDSFTLLGGVYGDAGFADYALFAGVSWNEIERTMADNLVVGGLDEADDHNLSFFVSPSLSFEDVLGANSQIRVIYTGTYQEASEFAFTNSTLGIDRRFSHQAAARVALGSQVGQNMLRYGVDLLLRDGAAIDYSVNGVPVTGAEVDDTVAGRAFLQLENDKTFFELGYASDDQLTGSASFKLTF